MYFFPIPYALTKVKFVPIKIYLGENFHCHFYEVDLAIKQQFLFCVSSVVWVHLFMFGQRGCMHSVNAYHYNHLLFCGIYLTSTFDWKETSYSTLEFLKKCKCAYSCFCRFVIYTFESCIGKLRVLVVFFCAWSQETLGAFHCMTCQFVVVVTKLSQGGVWVLCVSSYLGPLKRFLSKTLNSKKVVVFSRWPS